MRKRKRKLTAAERREKKRRRQQYMTIFVRGKQKRVKRPETIEEMDPDEFLIRNADPILLHQRGMWEYFEVDEGIEPPSWWELGEWIPDWHSVERGRLGWERSPDRESSWSGKSGLSPI